MAEQDSLATTLAATAYWTAAVRARETTRADALLHDPWAAALAGEIGATWLAQRSEDATLPIVLRARYFDDFLQHAIQEHAVQQVVLLAAGLDTRGLRLAWPTGVQLFELDQPAVLAHKQAVLDAMGVSDASARRAVPVDMTADWVGALLQAGFDPAQPAIWLLEGFLFYLPTATLTRILNQISALAVPASWLGCDVINQAMLTSPITRAWIEMQARTGAPWIGTLDDPVGFLAERGWQASLTQAGQPDAHHGRWRLPVLPTMQPDFPHNWFVTAQKIA